MVARGILDEDERFELIGGEVVPMSPTGRRHQILRSKLAFYMTRRASDDLMVVSEARLNFTDDSYVLPDILVHPSAIEVPDVRGPTALLVIEIADSNLDCDLQTKAPRYASHGVREYWVIDAQKLVAFVHRGPSGAGYEHVMRLTASDRLIPEAAPQLAVTLRDLNI